MLTGIDMDKRKPRRLFLLLRASACKKLQRCSERSLSHNRKISRSSTRLLQLQSTNKTKDRANTSCFLQSSWEWCRSFVSGDVENRSWDKFYSKQRGEVYQLSSGRLLFVDSYNCLQELLDSLVKSTPRKNLNYTSNLAKKKKQRNLFRWKDIYTYEYMDGWESFSQSKIAAQKQVHLAKWRAHNRKESKHAKKSGESVWVQKFRRLSCFIS